MPAAHWGRGGRGGLVTGGASAKCLIRLYNKSALQFKDNGNTSNVLEN